ncbi:hypothetical protein ACQ4PT_019624 [Festuca glaucescens]
MAMYDGGYDDAETSAFDALGYGGVDAAALFDLGGYTYAHDEPAGAASAYVPNRPSWANAGPSVLTFDRSARGQGAQAAAAAMLVADEEADCDAWLDAMDGDDQAAPASTIGFDPASGCFSLTQRPGGARRPFGLLFPGTSSADAASPAPAPASISQKRTNVNRREKISERLRTLQELVPNGTKVDMVTMLDKPMTYVKFLQLQVKVLATDEFWPEQGGMAPEISQVKEALDAILSSSPSLQNGQRN